MRLGFLLFVLLVSPVAAAETPYVVCDNGLRCVRAPCPSSTMRNLETGEEIRGVAPDISGLAEADQLMPSITVASC